MEDYDIAPVNRQLWENSPMNGSSVDIQAAENPDRLFNSKDPNLAIKHEKPEHRLMAMLKLQGKSNREIAALTQKTEAWVSQVFRQPWMKERLIAEINKAGREGLGSLLESTMVDSIFTIVELRDGADDEGVRLRAAQDLLDRHLGKATQRVETNSTVRHVGATAEEVDAELRRVEAEMDILIGPSANSGRSPERTVSTEKPAGGESEG